MSLIKCMLALLGFDAGDIAIFGVPGYRNESRWRFAFRAETFAQSLSRRQGFPEIHGRDV